MTSILCKGERFFFKTQHRQQTIRDALVLYNGLISTTPRLWRVFGVWVGKILIRSTPAPRERLAAPSWVPGLSKYRALYEATAVQQRSMWGLLYLPSSGRICRAGCLLLPDALFVLRKYRTYAIIWSNAYGCQKIRGGSLGSVLYALLLNRTKIFK